jgi:hypothetical protein
MVFMVFMVFLGGLLCGALLLPNFMSDSHDMQAVESIEHAKKHLIPGYVCPIHPSVVSNAPGSCPICGMDLEPKSLDAMGGNDEAHRCPDGVDGAAARPLQSLAAAQVVNISGVTLGHAGLRRRLP